MYSIVVPVYKNQENIPLLLEALSSMAAKLKHPLEVVFVVDGSPDGSYSALYAALPTAHFAAQLMLLSRNFGSFSAIRAGLTAARGDLIAVMAADLQEPPEFVLEGFSRLQAGRADLVVGVREARSDPLSSKVFSAIFWGLYRRCIDSKMPPGGVDVFACTAHVRDELVRLSERHSSLIGLLFWVGFRREELRYRRLPRAAGRSAWTFRRKMQYFLDSTYSFTDLPIRAFFWTGILGLLASLGFGTTIVALKLIGALEVPGYAATVVIVSFFGGLNLFGLGVIGNYVWRIYENSKNRPNYIVASHKIIDAGGSESGRQDEILRSSAVAG